MAALGLDCCVGFSSCMANRRYSSFGSGLLWGFSCFTQSLGTHLGGAVNAVVLTSPRAQAQWLWYMGFVALLAAIFPAQGPNPCLLHCQADS